MTHILIALSALFLVIFLLNYVKTKRRKKALESYKNYKKTERKRQIIQHFEKGLKQFTFDENKNYNIPAFRCYAINKKNAHRKYKNFLQSINN